MSALVLAIPSKGRLQEQTLAWFAACGLAIAQTGGERGYAASLPAAPEIEVRLAPAAEIAEAVQRGEVHLGVTGEDLLRELAPDLAGMALALPLGFGRADLVVAAPRAWLDVVTVADFAAVCAERRARTGHRLRVATKYAEQTRAFFAARGVEDYRIVASGGATEAAPAAGAAEAIVDITTTGATLAANGLRPLSDGVILRSQAQLAASRSARWDAPARAALERLLAAAEARAAGEGRVLLRIGAGPAPVEPLAAALSDLGCDVLAAGPAGLDVLCPKARAFDAAWRAAGEGRVVATLEVEAAFKRPVAAYERLLAALEP